MGRLKVTPKGKIKKNIPITRVGKKQYLKRRFAHIRAVDVAGANNRFTKKYVEGNQTATQSFTRLGLSIDPSAPKHVVEERKRKIKPESRQSLEEEGELKAHRAYVQSTRIGRPVSEQEGSMIANLIQRYGTNFKRMTLDRKLNPFQLNARQLQRQVVNYLKWEKAAFPEAFTEAEAKGWFSVEAFQDPRLRSGQQQRLQQVLPSKRDDASTTQGVDASAGGAGTKTASAKARVARSGLRKVKGAKQ